MAAAVGIAVALGVLPAQPVAANLLIRAPEVQDPDLIDRPVSAVRFEGLSRVSEQFVRNNVRAAAGDPYIPEIVRDDIRRLSRLGQFRTVDAMLELQADGSVHVIYVVQEQATLSVVQVVGNRLVKDQDILALVPLVTGDPVDEFRIQNAISRIEDLYRQRGHYLTTVTVNQTQLDESGVLIFTVIEGPRVRIKQVGFEGNQQVNSDQLVSQIKTRAYVPLLRKGVLDSEALADDVAAIDRYYRDRGYLDVRVDYVPELSQDNREAKVTFLIDEGRQYQLGSVAVRNAEAPERESYPLRVFTREQIAALMDIKVGDVFSQDRLRRSLQILIDAYMELGYLDVRVEPVVRRAADEQPSIELTVTITEGPRYKVGLVDIIGNRLTRDKVVRREVRLQPGRWFDGTEVDASRERLARTRLFGNVRTTLVDPQLRDSEYRDVLVEVAETDTGAVGFGIAVGSDSGAFGEISVTQRNWDTKDWPESIDEYIHGRAFRGAGQRFNMVVRPGDEIFYYSLGLTDPHFLESDYSLTVAGSVYQRRYRKFNEQRVTFNAGVSRRLGDVWTMGVAGKVEQVELTDIDADAPVDVFADAGPDLLTQLSFSLQRSTFSTLTRPGRGSRFEVGYDFVGALGGDVDFHRVSADYTIVFTLDEDFLGRLTTLRLNGRVGYILDSGRIPTYERFYMGGRSFRGFEYRGVGPKGIAADTMMLGDEPVGGKWLMFLGAQYEFPLFDEAMTGAIFLDSGTISDEFSLDEFRAAIGLGLRLYIPQLGPVPLAFDFAYPLLKEPTDDPQIFSFSVELPFR